MSIINHSDMEKIVQRLEAATLRLEALSSQKPVLAPKPGMNTMSPTSSSIYNLLGKLEDGYRIHDLSASSSYPF
ncbi:unnamed protein product [Dracunculus medinensis]|uniref:Uncharacterized protein n=1 Tax=Dracunculus medinensis TaxID=318479 RepID=A0A0N4UJD6_DRAME|nr:unnamed protein product [Dracunculus medinensis]